MKFPKNVLVCYQGGGYDGCYWEWNFFYFNADREFVDIHSSGRDGITDPDDAYQRYREIKEGTHGNEGQYRITARSQMHEFQAEYNPGMVVGVVKVSTRSLQRRPQRARRM